ncbi:MAG: restriction endonuclease subunit M [Anaerolineae bacterium]|nr:restriction endonuclease subunit M [Anaerolineae bacterium]
MDLQELRQYLNQLSGSLAPEDQDVLETRLHGLVSVFPFSEYEFILMFLRDREVISLTDYEKLRNNYVSANRYLDLFSLAPRVFGQIWGEKHIMDLDARFQKPDKTLDPHYDGNYDLWIAGIKVEVKSSRAIHTKKRGGLVSKALRYGSNDPFWMNFQQLKFDVCDIFIFIGVWVDQIIYWVMSNEEARVSRYLSHQHRGGIEYQIGITNRNLHEFDHFQVPPDRLAKAVLSSVPNSGNEV